MKLKPQSLRIREISKPTVFNEKELIASALKAKSIAKKQLFLSSIKAIAKKYCSDAISTHSGKTIDEVNNIFDLSINVNSLIDGSWASSGEQTMRFALASIYNTHSVIDVLQDNLLRQLEDEGYIKILRDDDGYAPKLPEKALFSASCINLDEENKGLLCKLMNNYQGW